MAGEIHSMKKISLALLPVLTIAPEAQPTGAECIFAWAQKK